MEKSSLTAEALLKIYGSDEKKLLTEHPSLENLYAFSNQREGAIEWIDFQRGRKVLVINDRFGAVVGSLLKKGLDVTVIDKKQENLDFISERYDVSEEQLHFFKGSIAGFSKNTQFDYIILFGNVHGEGECVTEPSTFRSVNRLLADNGKFIFCVDNRFGIQFLAGTQSNEEQLSKFEIRQLMKSAGMNEMHFYYPIYDYRLPFSIYSDDCLPKKGEISRYLPAYNYPKYLNVDIATKFAQSGDTGDFVNMVNSFIVIGGKPERAIFVKYNRTRQDALRIKTVIERDEHGKLSVVKAALDEAGKKHILSFEDKYERLSKEETRVSYLKADISADGMSARFPFIMGETFTTLLGREIKDGEVPVDKINEALNWINGKSGTANHDAIFDNFIIAKNGLVGIDYEWVEDKTLERKYTCYRALHAFFESFKHRLYLRKEWEFMKLFDISIDEMKRFEKEEQEFQSKVHGDNQKIYLDNYIVEPKTDKLMNHLVRERNIAIGQMEGIKKIVKERDTTIRKMTEVKRLTDNHVTNLEAIIENLRAENVELSKLVNYYGNHLSLMTRVKRKLHKKIDEKYPEGSEGRKKLKYRKLAFTHPGQYLKLKLTKKGRNLIEGDFKVGEDYTKYGKLQFAVEENPKVSIIIPVYNQIHYTYACLASILENTKDVTYEVIIADDVSTDATKELDRFVEGIVISRNETNQGFLKNCNQAAKKAKGQYIMFLNNDTKVHPRWLSSLVELIESDESIGMVGSKLVYPTGQLQEAGGIIWSDGSGWNYGRLQDPDDCEYNYVKDVDYISGAAILLSYHLWKQIGGFDERFAPAYCEDSDLAFEVRKAGYRVCYQPASVVTHFEGISNGTDVNGSGLKRYQVENSIKLKEKWAKEFALQYENIGTPDPFRARERSKGKKIILFVDHYVPTYDKDAGSKTTFQYLKMLVKKGYIVKFLGDNFAHEEPYTSTLEQMGIEVLYGSKMAGDIWGWIERHQHDLHLVYLNRPHIATKYIDFIKEHTDLKVVYYGHDLHFLREYREYQLTGDPKLLESSEYWKSIEFMLMEKADMSYYPSEVEVECIHDIDPEIKVKAITAYVYDEFIDHCDKNYEENEGLLFVGGFAHPPNADAVLWFVNEIFPLIREKLKVNFYIVGSKASDEIKALHNPEQGIIFKGFVTDEELENLYQKNRLVVVPLRYGAGVKGKVIEALHNGSAIVTTSTGAEGIPYAQRIMEVVDDPEEFANTVVSLYQDIRHLQKMSQTALDYIKEQNSVDAAWSVISEEFE